MSICRTSRHNGTDGKHCIPAAQTLWYSVNTQALQSLLAFLYAECCTRNKAIEPQAIVCCP
jgi:hypothetical protein